MRKFLLIFGAFSLFITVLVQAQPNHALKISIPEPAQNKERRVALVIGNSAYSVKPLPNPINDATDIAHTLRQVGFKVIEKKNLDYKQMTQAIEDFGKEIRNGGVGLFYYAGHGAQVKGENYLIPIGANIARESQLPYEAVNMGRILEEMENAHNRLNILILDACRNDPFAGGSRSGNRGLAIVNAPSGTLIAYSTSPGLTAEDGEGRNSPYAEALLKVMREPGLLVESAFKQARNLVRAKTKGSQTPWEVSSLVGDFYFSGSAGSAPSLRSAAVSRLMNTLEKSNVEVIDTLTIGSDLYILYTEQLNSGRWLQNPDGVKFLQCDVYVAKIDGQLEVRTLKLSTIYGFNTWVDRTNIGVARTHGAIDADADGIIVFVTEKKDTKDYGMTGFLYRISANDLTLTKSETLFPYSNMGWFPVIKNGVISHYSYAGLCFMRGVQQLANAAPADAISAYSTYRLKKIGAANDQTIGEFTKLAIQYISQRQ
jgi:hypothetical protein